MGEGTGLVEGCIADSAALSPRAAGSGSPRGSSPSRSCHSGGSPRAGRTTWGSVDSLAKGTRLVSMRIAAVPLVREVERERRSMFTELNQKILEAKARLDAVGPTIVSASAGSMSSAAWTQEREHSRTQAKLEAKLSELHAQKALKLFSMIAMCRRVTHPYIYLNGEASALPPSALAQPTPTNSQALPSTAACLEASGP